MDLLLRDLIKIDQIRNNLMDISEEKGTVINLLESWGYKPFGTEEFHIPQGTQFTDCVCTENGKYTIILLTGQGILERYIGSFGSNGTERKTEEAKVLIDFLRRARHYHCPHVRVDWKYTEINDPREVVKCCMVTKRCEKYPIAKIIAQLCSKSETCVGDSLLVFGGNPTKIVWKIANVRIRVRAFPCNVMLSNGLLRVKKKRQT